MPTLDNTVGGPSANTYVSLDEFADYIDSRIPFDPPVETSGDTAARALITATRVLDSMSVARRSLRLNHKGGPSGRPYYIVSRSWTGAPATEVQALAWPRDGMYDRLGREILNSVLPRELKEATSELAAQLQAADRTLDSDIETQGITSVKAGSVALTFKDIVENKVLPDAVVHLLPPSWFTDEVIRSATQVDFRAL